MREKESIIKYIYLCQYYKLLEKYNILFFYFILYVRTLEIYIYVVAKSDFSILFII